ncbi:MAG: transcriptional repressor LexA [Actinobacteria bacterium]|nr:MAG: transcriptional repressor LexA [Actinomycetota bacterium]
MAEGTTDKKRPGRPRGTGADDRNANGLSSRQQKILDMIRSVVAERGYPPSIREIGDAVGLVSPSSVAHQLHALEAKGFIRRDPHRPRAMEILAPAATDARPGVTRLPALEGAAGADEQLDDELRALMSRTAMVPVVGRIAAGGPILAEQSVETVFPLPQELVGDGELFLLRVVGDSMIDAAICDGDWVVVRSQQDAQPGEVVAALLDDEATVKTLKRRDGHTWLMPANPAYEPILGDHARIVGKVVSVLRRL